MGVLTEKNTKYNYLISVSIEAIANQLTLLLHQRLHEMKTVQTILNEYHWHDTETASRQILNQWPWRVQLLPRLPCRPSIV